MVAALALADAVHGGGIEVAHAEFGGAVDERFGLAAWSLAGKEDTTEPQAGDLQGRASDLAGIRGLHGGDDSGRGVRMACGRGSSTSGGRSRGVPEAPRCRVPRPAPSSETSCNRQQRWSNSCRNWGDDETGLRDGGHDRAHGVRPLVGADRRGAGVVPGLGRRVRGPRHRHGRNRFGLEETAMSAQWGRSGSRSGVDDVEGAATQRPTGRTHRTRRTRRCRPRRRARTASGEKSTSAPRRAPCPKWHWRWRSDLPATSPSSSGSSGSSEPFPARKPSAS